LKNRTSQVICCIVLMLAMTAIAAGAQDAPQGSPNKRGAVKTPDDVGLIFNVSNLLSGLESYQAGLGGELGWDKLSLRALLDLVVNSGAGTFSINTGGTVQYRLLPNPLSFYVGGSLGAGYMRQISVVSATHFSVSAVAGLEYFPVEFISIFMEYEVAADFTITNDLQRSQITFDYLIDTRMGNDSRIGIIFHIRPPLKRG
jgi:hypothetical protein